MIFQDSLVVVECANCHMNFGVTPAFQTARRKDHVGFLCPNGHSNVYRGKSEEEKLREENQRLQQRLDQNAAYTDSLDTDLAHERKSKQAIKGHLTRTKTRVAAGVCPCCNRTFGNLARHMASQHKDYTKSEAA